MRVDCLLKAGACVVLLTLASAASSARDVWTIAQSNRWASAQPWLVGANYIPASAINPLEMWQASTFDPERIDRELGWAEKIGMNAMRVFLHDLLWQEDPKAFQDRMSKFLEIAARHRIRILFVLFDSCWEPEPKLGPQHPPIPGVHNSGWVQSPGLSVLRDRSQDERLEGYVKGVVGAFARDPRVLGWDVWNEPGAPPSDEDSLATLLQKVFVWTHSMNPTQPLTSAVFQEGGGWTKGEPSGIEKIQLEQSDVISFHDYHWPEVFESKASVLLKRGRPVWCTEYLARGVGSTFDGILPIGNRLHLGMFNWGLVDGKTQTRLPWDSWIVPYTNGREPAVWHHDVFHADGTPYRAREAELIQRLAQKK